MATAVSKKSPAKEPLPRNLSRSRVANFQRRSGQFHFYCSDCSMCSGATCSPPPAILVIHDYHDPEIRDSRIADRGIAPPKGVQHNADEAGVLRVYAANNSVHVIAPTVY